MQRFKQLWIVAVLLVLVALTFAVERNSTAGDAKTEPAFEKKHRSHLDHAAFFHEPFSSPQAVTDACLECHEDAAEGLMKTAHWNWLGDEVMVPGHDKPMRIGKKNLINNFCIGIQGNWPSCTRCHPGYGWKDDTFDFKKESNVDCLVCHDWTGDYQKGKAGMPKENVDLLAVAKGVGYPKRENCGTCHFFGGGGLGVKHGDLDNSLDYPTEDVDIHMSRHGFLCVDCHKTENHAISGKSITVSVDHKGGIGCTDCHREPPHKDQRINDHLDAVACQTCHIPTFARKVPTKMDWDWSKAGDDARLDNVHEYLKIKGEFVYEQSVEPEYAWFNLTSNRYILGDPMDPDGVTSMNTPRGDIHDPTAKIWPFKVHRGKQPYDAVNKYFISPVTAGEGGYWREFDWDQAMRLGAELGGLEYSGQYGFAKTEMYWPLSHMVAPKEGALGCADCHGEKGRMDWKALGYGEDPARTGGRR